MGKWNDRRWLLLAFVTGGSLGMAGGATAGTVYSWQTEDGTMAYTDDAKRIPARYKDQARRSTLQPLGSYARYTPLETSEAYGERLTERRTELQTEATSAAPDARTDYLTLRPGARGSEGGLAIAMPEGAGPLEIEEVRAQGPGNATRHLTVVKRDGEVIAVIKAERNQSPNTSTIDEDDL